MNIFILLLCVSTAAFANEFSLVGTRPFVSLTKRFGPRWELNGFYAETVNATDRHFRQSHFVPRDLQSYFQTGLTYKLNPNVNFSGGYVFQRNNPLYRDFSNENRLWQQVVLAHKLSASQISHRFRYEERFIENRNTKSTDKMATRLRYQLSYTLPLEGQELDPDEYFFNAYNESYFSLTGQRNAWYSENWTYAGLGYLSASAGKFELGPLLQWAKVNTSGDVRKIYLLQVGWSYTF